MKLLITTPCKFHNDRVSDGDFHVFSSGYGRYINPEYGRFLSVLQAAILYNNTENKVFLKRLAETFGCQCVVRQISGRDVKRWHAMLAETCLARQFRKCFNMLQRLYATEINYKHTTIILYKFVVTVSHCSIFSLLICSSRVCMYSWIPPPQLNLIIEHHSYSNPNPCFKSQNVVPFNLV